MKLLLSSLFFLFAGWLQAQTNISMPQAGISTSVGCGPATFTDSGGTSMDYSGGESGIVSFCPTGTTNLVSMDFTQLDIAAGDFLRVYDGDSTAAPLLVVFSDTTTPPGVIAATPTNSSGCLTFEFVSNSTGVGAGWQATRGCIETCQTITPQITTVPPIDPDGILRICQGENVQFNGQTSFSEDGTGATYQWDFNVGAGFVAGQNQQQVFNNPGSYQVQFQVTDAAGCTDDEVIDLIVQVSTDPDFTGTETADATICLGESTTLTGSVQSVPFERIPARPITGVTFLPDGTGAVYSTCIEVEGFSPGATFNNASDLISMFMNIEHSWTDDLDIILTAPNGSSIEILQTFQSGGEKFLGIPDQSDTPDPPGIGFTYVITEQPVATQTFRNALAALPVRTSLPEGSYQPSDPFSNFIGSSLNGQWCLTVTDNLQLDNGYIFEWGLNFDPARLPANLSFEPTIVREEWQADPTIISTSGNQVTVQPDRTGLVCYTYEIEDSFGCIYTQEICVQVNELPQVQEPIDLLVCDNVGNINTVDLTQNTSLMLTGQNAAQFEVNYYQSLADATASTNPITSPAQYAAPNAPQTIHTTITNRTTGCSIIRNFEVSINQAIFNAASNIVLCDDPSNDGLAVFDLTSQNTTIIGSQDPATVVVTFHRSIEDANTGVNPITDPANYVIENAPQQNIFVRVENAIDNTCFDTGSFQIILGPNPVANTISDFQICDDAGNNGRAIFDLSTRDIELLGTQDPAIFEVSYYLSITDANSRQNPLNKFSFENTSNPQTIIARIDSRLNNACFDTTTVDLSVGSVINVTGPPPIVVCDDPSGDGLENVDLSINENIILNGANPANFIITYHQTAAAANGGIDPLPTTITVDQAATDIYVRVEGRTNGCAATTQFTVEFNAVPNTTAVNILQACDQNGDGSTIFELGTQIEQIIDGQTGVQVTFFETLPEAITGANPLNERYSSLQTNQTIFYRSEFTATGCFTTGSFVLQSIAPPVAGTPDTVILCDPGTGVINYNLDNSSAQIINGQPDATVTYYATQLDAFNATAPLDLSFNYRESVVVYARLETAASECFDVVALPLEFGELPVSQLPNQTVLCRDAQGVLVDGPAVLNTGLNAVDFNFEWRLNGQLVVGESQPILTTEQPGDYEVVITDAVTQCSITDTANVRYSGPPEDFEINVVTAPFEDNHRIEITAQGPDTYWYQLDDGLYQDNPVFYDVTPGLHTITLAERNGCGAITTEVFVFGYPRFFTPNFDGFNDTWNVEAGDRLPILRIYIFDRYGKLLKELDPQGSGWDGTFLGELMPSSDYWFRLEYEFDGQSGEATGHFTLKR